MQRRLAPTVYAIDAGGSHTVVAVEGADGAVATWRRESFAIASAGDQAARATLEAVLREIADHVGPDALAVGCVASSSMPVGDEAGAPALIVDALRGHAPPGRVVLVNDVIPPLWAEPLCGKGIVMCSGTGSSVVGRALGNGGGGDASARTVKIGGHEHIVSDQGSAYSIARAGLRAAASDADGIGPATKLRAAAEAFFGRPLPALGRWLAELPRARSKIASFAPCVTSGAEDHDRVAQEILDAEARALVDAVAAAAARLQLSPLPPIALTGGVLRGSPPFRRLAEAELCRRGLTDDAGSNLHIVDGVAASRAFATRLADPMGSAPDGVVLEI